MSSLIDTGTIIDKGFEHLDRLSDARGLFEHTLGTVRREEHGYCTDDNARLLLVASRDSDVVRARSFGRCSLNFVRAGVDPDGRVRNRMNVAGVWTDEPGTEDCWGRAVWALGFAGAHHTDPAIKAEALSGFNEVVQQRSPWSRAMAFAALGAAEIVSADCHHGPAQALLVDAVDVILGDEVGSDDWGGWAWPEPRLRYANASLAEAVIASGAVLGNSAVLDTGLKMLGWLLALETASGVLSLTGVSGRGPGDVSTQFDQQAIEAAAMADACWRAHTVTGDDHWLDGVDAAEQWFHGRNDSKQVMYDDSSGGGFDGLERHGVNENQGAESTLALVVDHAARTTCLVSALMTPPTITDTGIRLAPDLSRVITRFFVPGREDSGPGDSRADAGRRTDSCAGRGNRGGGDGFDRRAIRRPSRRSAPRVPRTCRPCLVACRRRGANSRLPVGCCWGQASRTSTRSRGLRCVIRRRCFIRCRTNRGMRPS